ncbi:hypothetical protein NO2_0928 [Candidatus Termititenax persephonae]|uniref:Xylose isomerase-like TIM barrel domain-containing protein n=1 Tax=Candidatus Termititenax persephonae TaxID=2218525 RepID=A0A388TGV3_9BACT|nr:hypothetical protein NO2_0928 [Candidatus Termititenax persephonae]
MKLGLKLWSVNTDTYYAAAQKLYQENIFAYIELYIVPGTLHTLEAWRKLKIPFVLHAPHFAHGLNLACKEKEDSNAKIYKETKQFADELQVQYIIFHGGVDGTIQETARQLAGFHEPRALLENKPYVGLPKMGGQLCRGYSPQEAGYVLEQAHCGFCLDFGHAICAANSLKKDVYAYVRDFLPLKPKMFHLTDVDDITSEYDSHPHLGAGQLDMSKILTLLPQEAMVTVETLKSFEDNLNDFAEDIRYLRHLLG